MGIVTVKGRTVGIVNVNTGVIVKVTGTATETGTETMTARGGDIETTERIGIEIIAEIRGIVMQDAQVGMNEIEMKRLVSVANAQS